MEISYHNSVVISMAPERQHRTSANNIDTFLHGEKISLITEILILNLVIWNTKSVIV